ncbi:MAG: flagellin [Myxococcota bacterium]|jgi:flagellin|nr:flagellin [Myxococcota bacterium]
MALTLNGTIATLQALGNFNRNQDRMTTTLDRISSGLRVNRSADDPSGLAIATNLNTQVRAAQAAMRNATTGTSIIQTAEGSAEEVVDLLERIRELAVQASSETITSTERTDINDEYVELQDEITRLSDSTEFNGITLTNGSTDELNIFVGTRNAATSSVTVALEDIDSSALGIDSLDLSTTSGATTSIDLVDSALDTISSFRSKLGASQNRLDSAVGTLSSYSENLSIASSVITSADLALETANFASYEIINNAAISALIQAQNMNASIVKLLAFD